MESKEYLEALRSPNITNLRKALKSGYVPKNEKEVEVTSESVILGGNSDLQRIAFNIFSEYVPLDIAIHGYIILAVKSHREKVRLDAVKKMLEDYSSEVTEALLIASYDGEIEVQKTAISALAGRESPEILPLLLSRIEEPGSSISSTFSDRKNEIKSVAISSLGVKNQNIQIPDLIKIAVKEPEFRPEVKSSLERIGTSEVTEQLLSIIEGTYHLDDDEVPYEVDEELKLYIANIIPSIEATNAQVDSYRLILCSLYKDEIVKGATELSNYLHQYFNEDVGTCLTDVIELHSSNLDVVTRVINDLARVPFRLSFPFWLKILNKPEEPITEKATKKITEILGDDIADFPKLLSSSIKLGESPAHKKTRLIQVVVNLSSDNIKSFSDALVPYIRDTEDPSSELAKRYLTAIWQNNPTEKRDILLDSIFNKGYLKRKDGREYLGQIFIDTWDSGSEESREKLYRKFIEKRFRSTSEPTIAAIDDLLKILVEKVSNPGYLAGLIVSDLDKISKDNKRWEPLTIILSYSPIEESGRLLIESLNRKWKRTILELAIYLNAEGIDSFCRSALQNADYELPQEDAVWLIQILGEYKKSNDADLFTGFITSEKPVDIQVEAIRSLSKLPFDDDIASSLIRSLKNPKEQVVTAAIIAIGNSPIPTVEVVSALQERANPNEEEVSSIRKNAKKTLGILTQKHLANIVDKKSDDEIFENWLEVLRQIGVCECQKILDDLFRDHADPEHANRRISIIKTISSSTKPDDGLEVLKKYIVNERVAPVKDAIKAALDELEGHPDRADFKLLENVIGQNINKNDLLGKWHLNEVFSEERTIVAFREGLRRALGIHKDNDALVEQLDAISDALIRDLFNADKDILDPDGKIPDDAHDNRIGKLKSNYPEIALPANAIHELRKLKVKGPHSYDPSGAVRPGVDNSDRKHAIESFSFLFKEIIKTLRRIKEK